MSGYTEKELRDTVDQIIAANPDKALQADIRSQLRGWFVDQAMQALAGTVPLQDVKRAVFSAFLDRLIAHQATVRS